MTPGAHFQGRAIHAGIFDLDGTLPDTAGDRATALGRAMAEQGHPAPPLDVVRNLIGKGAPILVQRASDALSLNLNLMVGDSRNDVSAGLAAGMAVVAVPYGYNEGQNPRSLNAHVFVDSVAELPQLLGLTAS